VRAPGPLSANGFSQFHSVTLSHRRTKTQLGILAGPDQQNRSFRNAIDHHYKSPGAGMPDLFTDPGIAA